MENHQERDHMLNTDNEQRNNENKKQQAIARGTTPERVDGQKDRGAKAVSQTPEQSVVATGQMPRGELQDGYKVNQGDTYDREGPGQEAEEYYDPAHSGVRHAANRPGKRINTPGREEGTAWSEQSQMGRTIDTAAECKNPAN